MQSILGELNCKRISPNSELGALASFRFRPLAHCVFIAPTQLCPVTSLMLFYLWFLAKENYIVGVPDILLRWNIFSVREDEKVVIPQAFRYCFIARIHVESFDGVKPILTQVSNPAEIPGHNTYPHLGIWFRHFIIKNWVGFSVTPIKVQVWFYNAYNCPKIMVEDNSYKANGSNNNLLTNSLSWLPPTIPAKKKGKILA